MDTITTTISTETRQAYNPSAGRYITTTYAHGHNLTVTISDNASVVADCVHLHNLTTDEWENVNGTIYEGGGNVWRRTRIAGVDIVYFLAQDECAAWLEANPRRAMDPQEVMA